MVEFLVLQTLHTIHQRKVAFDQDTNRLQKLTVLAKRLIELWLR